MMDREEFEDLLCAITASTIANIVEETGMSEEEAADGVKVKASRPCGRDFFVRAYHNIAIRGGGRERIDYINIT